MERLATNGLPSVPQENIKINTYIIYYIYNKNDFDVMALGYLKS